MKHSGIIVLAIGIGLGASIIGGCHKNLRTVPEAAPSADTDTTRVAVSGDGDLKAGALMWSQNCMRCHNLRNPRERSDRQWDVIVHHMRVRANLTAEEHRSILRFLQSAN
jgi:hypothetical protein